MRRCLRIGGRMLALGLGLLFLLAARAGASTGPDVSNYQHPNGAAINWNQVRAAGHTFAFVKATEGPSGAGGYYTNPYFASDWTAAANAGLYRGAYHFAQPQRPLDSAVLQARYFVSVTGAMHGIMDLPPVLDLESTGGLSRTELAAWTQSWLSEVERLTGRRPIIYTGYYFWNDNVGSTNFGAYRLWIPRYTSAPDPYPVPVSWPTWTLWQYTSSAHVPGIVGNVDMNVFCCPDANLAALADGSSASQAVGNPFGALDGTARGPASLSVSGWAMDPDTRSSIGVHVYVDGVFRGAVTASDPRGDIAAQFPGWGNPHGYHASYPVGPGPHEVCAYAINKSLGTGNTTLGCRIVQANPSGVLDAATSSAPGQLAVTGWAIDPDTTGPVTVHVYVDGHGAAVVSADGQRDDLAALYPSAGGAHGFTANVAALASGPHSVCVYAINSGSGDANSTLGCTTVDVLSSNPVGRLTTVSSGPGDVLVSGWGYDPDTSAPIAVHVYVDGRGTALVASGIVDPTVELFGSDIGSDHGFSTVVGGLSPGAHQICAYGINTGPGANALFECRAVTVATGGPIGALDEVSARLSMVTVRGWAIDPDTTAVVRVHVYVDGTFAGEGPAGEARDDIGAVFPLYGAGHGYLLTVGGIGGGHHTVCTYGINVGPGGNALLGCATIDTPGDPHGSLDAAVAGAGGATIAVTGWSIDPDTTQPIQVAIYVDDVGAAVLSANLPRNDVAGDFPRYGNAHGFTATLSGLSPGAHTVCAYGLDVGPGTNALLGCLSV